MLPKQKDKQMSKKKTRRIRTRGKTPFTAYDLHCQKLMWHNTKRLVEFGTGAVSAEMTASLNMEGALWIMETTNNLRTFAYSSSSQGDCTGPWEGVSWTDLGMWFQSVGPVPHRDFEALFVNTETAQRIMITVDTVVNRTNNSLHKPVNPIQFIDDKGEQWLCNWNATKWWNRNNRNNEEQETVYFDAVYIFFEKNTTGINTIHPIL